MNTIKEFDEGLKAFFTLEEWEKIISHKVKEL